MVLDTLLTSFSSSCLRVNEVAHSSVKSFEGFSPDIDFSNGCEVSSDLTLLDYVRNVAEHRGTKYMCRQAGCGACIVAARTPDSEHLQAVNSCMVSITSCQDWDIQTIEQLGDRKKGYHPIQKALANHNGSQCGYCSPGWVMSMYSLLQEKKDITMLDVEKSLGSNICRCTGYRPILEAFKTFAKDHKNNIPDIEELTICAKTGTTCNEICKETTMKQTCSFNKTKDNNASETKHNDQNQRYVDIHNCPIESESDEEDWCVVTETDVTEDKIKYFSLCDGRKWFKVNQVKDICQIFQREGTDSYMLVGGNTAKGAYPIEEYPKILIDINGTPELKRVIVDQNLIIGSAVTLTKLLNIYKNISQNGNFKYLQEFYNHLEKVAHIAVRNLGTIGGNLMIKYQHNEFQSDLYLMFQTVGADLTILNRQGKREIVTMEQFLSFNMTGAVILNVRLPPLADNVRVKTYKTMPRSQNAHAIVNFGAYYQFSKCGNKLVQCRLVYGGLKPGYTRACSTEAYLVNKYLYTNETLQGAIKSLENELVVTEIPPEPSAMYRKKLAIGLFYKSLLGLCPQNILNPRFRSGVSDVHDTRPVSRSKRSFETTPAMWPLTKPIPKLEALIQCAGEASYTEDLPKFPHEVFGNLVLSTVGRGTIVSLDAKNALDSPGVIAVYTAEDIPGLNSFTPDDDMQYTRNEEVLCSGEVKYYNQPVAIVVAETRHIAELASKMVKVTYKNEVKPVVDIKDAKKDPKRMQLLQSIEATDKGADVCKVIKGTNTMYGQYHFTLETIACVVRPTEEGIEAYVTTQWTDGTQTMISRALNMDESRIDVHVRRCGGGFGIKISRSILPAVAASLVVSKLNRPCRFIQSMQTLVRAYGKRFPCSSDYEVGVNKSGVIQYLNHKVFEDNGYTVNEELSVLGVDVYFNCYDKSRWNFSIFDVETDTAKNTWFRGPGTFENIAFSEMIMERITYELCLDPIEARLANVDSQYSSNIREMLNTLQIESQYKERRQKVVKFNKENRWKKRRLRFVPMRWSHNYPRIFDVNLSVYQGDGSVSIVHGGVEIGQGINTRAAQIAAYFLKIPLDKIQVKSTNTIFTPNGSVTGGSVTTQYIGLGVEKCCKELLANLKPVKSKMNNPTWPELIKRAYMDGVDLQIHGYVGNEDKQSYNIYGMAFAEVEIDVLTGETEIRRVDIMEDAGQSLNPELDVGQVEGAFVMGIGSWMLEHLVYDQDTGEVLTDRSWNYYVPQARDIPQDFRVYLRKNSYGNAAILGSKAIGEPPICMSVVVAFAIREAITAARADSGLPTTTWFPFDGPMTTEAICLNASTRLDEYKFC